MKHINNINAWFLAIFGRVYYLKDGKAWVIAIFGSLIILLVNLVVVPPLYKLAGAPVTVEQTFVVSGILFLARILWFYALLLWRLLWNKE